MKQRLAISCSGEGLGHAMRVMAYCDLLKDRHDLVFWVPETVAPLFRERYPDHRVYLVPLLKLYKHHHRIQLFKTGILNSLKMCQLPFFKKLLASQFEDEQIEALISDYEPFSCYAARSIGIPILALNHQGVLNGFKRWSLGSVSAQVSNWFMMPTYDRLVTSSFYEGDVGPLLRSEIETLSPQNGDDILVYLKPSFKPQILPLLSQYPDENFDFFPQEGKDFLTVLSQCKAVIAPAGHQLLCEALYFKKPILAVPESGQYEQQLNGEFLVNSGYGMASSRRKLSKVLAEFIASLDQFPLPQTCAYRFCFDNQIPEALQHIELFLRDYLSNDSKR